MDNTGQVIRQRFWEIYSKNINEKANNDPKFYNKYSDNKKWTKEITIIAKKSIKQLFPDIEITGKTKFQIDKEYFRVDLVGYLTHWEEERKKKIPERQHIWHLKVAYEHENSEDWSDELCKLCYIAADLRIIHSYYLNRKKGIKEQLQQYVNRLEKEDILNRIPNNNWLFIFGVMGEHDKPFQAFTLNESKKVELVEGGEEVIPSQWKR